MILIALGANLPSRYGTPEETLRKALEKLDELGVEILRTSSVWVTEPVPVSDQPWYRNAVALVETELNAEGLLTLLHAVEEDFGRIRSEKNAARLLDLDLLAYNDEIHNDGHFDVPHPRMHSRAFVLGPMQEIVPEWKHPLIGLSVAELIDQLPDDQKDEISNHKAA